VNRRTCYAICYTACVLVQLSKADEHKGYAKKYVPLAEPSLSRVIRLWTGLNYPQPLR
jgi:hypothetical protein